MYNDDNEHKDEFLAVRWLQGMLKERQSDQVLQVLSITNMWKLSISEWMWDNNWTIKISLDQKLTSHWPDIQRKLVQFLLLYRITKSKIVFCYFRWGQDIYYRNVLRTTFSQFDFLEFNQTQVTSEQQRNHTSLVTSHSQVEYKPNIHFIKIFRNSNWSFTTIDSIYNRILIYAWDILTRNVTYFLGVDAEPG